MNSQMQSYKAPKGFIVPAPIVAPEGRIPHEISKGLEIYFLHDNIYIYTFCLHILLMYIDVYIYI